jgi:predicted CXXCH cytochrome family protein
MYYYYYFLTSVLLFLGSGQYYQISITRKDCIECHGDLLKRKYIHSDLATTCDICHTSSGIEHPKAGTVGFKLTESVPELCYGCHSDHKENAGKSMVLHGPFKDKKSCINCHSPHSSDTEKILLLESNQLCLSCHNKSIRTDSLNLENISRILKLSKSIHPPVENGGCVICHNPHFANQPLLLAGTFPAGKYAKAIPESFELCFMCHDSDLITSGTTQSATNFRNGNKNLHFLHIKGDKGRTCSFCHNVHGAPNERLIENTVQFGQWGMRLNFKITDNGGSCSTGCHGLKKYNRLKPEINQ